MKNLYNLLLATATCVAITPAIEARTFTAVQSGKWTDPKLWSPYYPGSVISADDSVIVNSNITLNTCLIIHGDLKITKGAALQGNKEVIVEKNGSLSNYGNTVFGKLTNDGKVDNDLILETMQDFSNNGIINNSNTTVVGRHLLNQSGEATGNGGAYFANGTVVSQPDATFGKKIEVFEAPAEAFRPTDLDESFFASLYIDIYKSGTKDLAISIPNLDEDKVLAVVYERSLDGKNFEYLFSSNSNKVHTTENYYTTSKTIFYRATVITKSGKQVVLPTSAIRNDNRDSETLSFATPQR
jgi:hypothetical protein